MEIKTYYELDEILKLHPLLQKEWQCVRFSGDNQKVLFEKFKKLYDNFKGPTIDEFLSMPDVVYNLWEAFKRRNGYNLVFKKYIHPGELYRYTKDELRKHSKIKTLTEVWNEFKEFWKYDSLESKVMFKEMGLLSENMLREWDFKYNFTQACDYGDYHCRQEEREKKPKTKLWEEFKEKWEIDVDNYDELKYDSMEEYVNHFVDDYKDYCSDYPRNFWEYCEDANYHSFDSYTILAKVELCQEWSSYRCSC